MNLLCRTWRRYSLDDILYDSNDGIVDTVALVVIHVQINKEQKAGRILSKRKPQRIPGIFRMLTSHGNQQISGWRKNEGWWNENAMIYLQFKVIKKEGFDCQKSSCAFMKTPNKNMPTSGRVNILLQMRTWNTSASNYCCFDKDAGAPNSKLCTIRVPYLQYKYYFRQGTARIL